MPTTPLRTYSGQGIMPLYGDHRALNLPVSLPAGVSYAKGTVLGLVPGTGTAVNHVQTITPSGTVSGGTWRISFGGCVTSALAHNADAATIKAALVALANIGSADYLTVTGGGLDAAAVVITFTGKMGGLEQPAMLLILSLTGSGATAAVAQTTKGKPAGGHYPAYDDSLSDGREVAKAILQYPCTTNTYGQITFGDTADAADNDNRESQAPAWFRGEFKTSELTGIDANGVTDLGRIIQGIPGTLSNANTVLSIR